MTVSAPPPSRFCLLLHQSPALGSCCVPPGHAGEACTPAAPGALSPHPHRCFVRIGGPGRRSPGPAAFCPSVPPGPFPFPACEALLAPSLRDTAVSPAPGSPHRGCPLGSCLFCSLLLSLSLLPTRVLGTGNSSAWDGPRLGQKPGCGGGRVEDRGGRWPLPGVAWSGLPDLDWGSGCSRSHGVGQVRSRPGLWLWHSLPDALRSAGGCW